MSSKREMPFLDHMEELRWRIIWSLAAVVVGAAIGIFGAIRLNVIDILLKPLHTVVASIAESDPEFLGILGGGRLVFLSLTEPFFFILRLGLLSGVILASPVIVYQAWAFLTPALADRERRIIIPSMVLGLLLFSMGAALAYFIALPMSIRFLLLFGAEWFTPALTGGSYLSFVLRLLLAFGGVFELPVLIAILSALGLVTADFLRRKRRYALAGSTVAACVLSPGDVLTVTVLLMVPLVLLYEVSIWIAAVIERRRGEPDSDIDPTPATRPMPTT